MDTPDRKQQIGTPVSKFEDSPVFNYINSLSPIQPVKSVHIGQTFNSLTFSSPPSVFTSPHVSSHRESRFLRRNFFSSSAKPDLSSVDGVSHNESEAVLDTIQVPDCSADPTESFDGDVSIEEVMVDKKNDNSELAIELPRTLKYNCDSPDCKTDSSHNIKTDSVHVVSEVPATLDQFGGDVSIERCRAICEVAQNKEEEIGCDWENLMTDASDLLIFNSSNNTNASNTEHQNTVEFADTTYGSVALPEGNVNDMQSTQPLDRIDFCENHEVDNVSLQLAAGEQTEFNHTPDIISSTLQNKMHVNFPTEMIYDKAGSHIPFDCKQRGVRRRCLVFESAGARKRKLDDDSNSSSSVSSQSDEKYASNDKPPLLIRPCTSSSSCMIPGIGLHLNALAATTIDSRVIKHETLSSGRELISFPSSLSSVHSFSSEQKTVGNSLSLKSVTDISPAGNDLQSMVDASRTSASRIAEDFNENSPKKKRRRSEHGGESEACKRCNCKKSKCLKLYCECFAAGVYCVEPCSCQECFNKPVHEDTVLATRKQIESRNPLAFAPKVIRNSDSAPETGEEFNKTPASARHKRGCNCKKSNCLKKYCECYQGGVGCSHNCRCESCKNTFGMKDGSTPTGFGEAEPTEEGTEAGDRDGLDNSLHTKDTRKGVEQCPELVLPLSFSFQICRTSIQLPFSSFGKPPRSSLASQPKFEKHFQVIPDDETPAILRGNFSPVSGIKTSSPNSKRVSPPHRDFTSSPGRKNNRRLVLQSIPSFPSLNQHGNE